MIRETADIAILGAGFAGSLAALVLQRVGRRPVLIDRGAHPRFAIGESSTPTANLTLEALCRDYDLPRLYPLTKYGRWQRAYPQLACGLKRGFSFFQHQPGEPFKPSPQHANELLVGASPNDEIGDTHWFREEFDHFLVREAQAAGIPYLDRCEITSIVYDRGWRLRGEKGVRTIFEDHASGRQATSADKNRSDPFFLGEETVEISASFLIDATGPAGALARALGIDTDPAGVGTNSWSIYSHFTGVELWEDLLGEMGATTGDYPYRCDFAALHHVLADGWMWVLRFNNGVTSAGIAFDGQRHPPDASRSPEVEWENALRMYPSLARQFARAEMIRPWVRTGRMQRRARRAAGEDWAMLPHAVYFFDPLFSAGNAHTLVGIQRLARILEPGNRAGVADGLASYERQLFREIEFLDWLVHGTYRAFGRFDLLAAYTMYYFAGAVQSETLLRSGSDGDAAGFLFSNHEPFRRSVKQSYEAIVNLGDSTATRDFANDFSRRVARDIAEFNPAGLCDAGKRNMYPFV